MTKRTIKAKKKNKEEGQNIGKEKGTRTRT